MQILMNSDSSSDSGESDDMPFAWVPDAVPVEKSPPRKSKKSPENRSKPDEYSSGNNNNNGISVHGGQNQNQNDISLARQCAQPPALTTFQHVNKHHEHRQLMYENGTGMGTESLLSIVSTQFNKEQSDMTDK